MQIEFWSYRNSSHNREFHNVNCRFCGAIHSVNWAYISVLSQVIHSVNERKTVWTNIIFFVSYGDRILTTLGSHCFSRLLFRSLSECPANRNIIFRLYRFSFSLHIKFWLVRGRLCLPFKSWKSTTESAALRQLNSGLQHAFTDTVAQSTIAFLLWRVLDHLIEGCIISDECDAFSCPRHSRI